MTAGKLLHGKRPRLIPIYDDKAVKPTLHVTQRTVWEAFWCIFRHADVRNQLAEIQAAVPTAEDLSLLRVLDIITWMSVDGVGDCRRDRDRALTSEYCELLKNSWRGPGGRSNLRTVQRHTSNLHAETEEGYKRHCGAGVSCLCASQRSAIGDRWRRSPGKDEERKQANFSPRAAVSMTTSWSEPSTWTPRYLSVTDRLLKLRYPATCVKCGGRPLGRDSRLVGLRSSVGDVHWLPPASDPRSLEIDPRLPLSLTPWRTHRRVQLAPRRNSWCRRKHRRREAEIDQKWGRLSGVVKFLSEDPQSTKAWAKGSEGERKLAAHLVRTVGERAVMLHDRKIPGSRANIDHLVVAASGIWIIDAKSYKGKVEQRDVGKWLQNGQQALRQR